MPKTYTAPQDYEESERPAIELKPVESSQIKAVGYDESTQTLAVQFKHGAGAIYHYHGVDAETHAAFIGAESLGKFHGAYIKPLPFKKYRPEAATA